MRERKNFPTEIESGATAARICPQTQSPPMAVKRTIDHKGTPAHLAKVIPEEISHSIGKAAILSCGESPIFCSREEIPVRIPQPYSGSIMALNNMTKLHKFNAPLAPSSAARTSAVEKGTGVALSDTSWLEKSGSFLIRDTIEKKTPIQNNAVVWQANKRSPKCTSP